MKKYDTRQRDYLINFLDQHPDQLLSVRQIAQELCSQQISLSAVYRNLSQLEAEGLIRKSIKPGSREAYYQYVGRGRLSLPSAHVLHSMRKNFPHGRGAYRAIDPCHVGAGWL